MERFYANNEGVVDIKEVLSCFTTDIIGSCAFGLDFNAVNEENSPFRLYGKKFLTSDTWRNVCGFFAENFQGIARTLHLRVVPKDVSDFFYGVVRNTIEYRRTNNYKRPDFLQLLLDMNEKFDGQEGDEARGLTFDEIVSQSFLFFLAGFETSSSTMTYVLYELARHQDYQDKVRAEIEQVLARHDGKITYEAIQKMKYMNQVIDEALRMYPPVPFVNRQCINDYDLPDEGFTIKKGTIITIPIYGLQNDPEYYPKPHEFDPERFNDANKQKNQAYSYMPFGEGPRICIGMRFGLMQTKVGLTALLRTYKFTVNKKTMEPFTFQKNSIVLAVEGDIWLTAHKI